MNSKLRLALLKCETDIEGAVRRFSDNEELYISCLGAFLTDQTISDLDESLNTESWDEAFTAAHALKGLAGNMGFVPLFHAAAELVVLIRTGKTGEVCAAYIKLKKCYKEITSAIDENINVSEE